MSDNNTQESQKRRIPHHGKTHFADDTTLAYIEKLEAELAAAQKRVKELEGATDVLVQNAALTGEVMILKAQIKSLEADNKAAWDTNRAIDKARMEEMAKRDELTARVASYENSLKDCVIVPGEKYDAMVARCQGLESSVKQWTDEYASLRNDSFRTASMWERKFMEQSAELAALQSRADQDRADAERLVFLMDMAGRDYEAGAPYQLVGRLREYIDAARATQKGDGE